MDESNLDLLHLLPAVLDRLALAVVMGGSAVAAWLLASSTHKNTLAPPLRTLFDIALPALLISSAALLWLRTSVMADVPVTEAGTYLWRVVSHSQFGTIWLWRLAAIVVMAAIWFGGTRRELGQRGAVLMLAAGIVVAITISATSHAGDEGLLTRGNLINSLHICAGASWGGAVIAYLALLRRMSRHGFNEDIAGSATGLSTLATVALAVVIPSGIYNAWEHIPELADLWQSGYGNTLLVKLVLVGVMMTIGALNRFRVIPDMLRSIRTGATRPRPASRFIRVLSIDMTVFILLMACAAALGLQGPPMH